MDFIAIDFETANEKRWSPCEVSLVKVSGGVVIDRLTSLIRPHDTVAFNPRNIQIHGISQKDVASAPEFDVVIRDVLEFLDGLPLVAHSAGFDVGVLTQTSSLYSVQLPPIEYFCTRVLSQRSQHLDLANYKLVNVCDALGIDFLETHRAEADAIACAQVTVELAKLEAVADLRTLANELLVIPGVLSGTTFIGTRSARVGQFPSALGKGAASEFLASLSEDEMQLDNDFDGKEVIFTGTLASMERKEAQQKVLLAGGFTGNNITKKTSMVVVGSPYDAELRPGAELSGKLRKVLDLRAQGVDIVILTEAEFLELFEN